MSGSAAFDAPLTAMEQIANKVLKAPENSRQLAYIEAQVHGCPVRRRGTRDASGADGHGPSHQVVLHGACARDAGTRCLLQRSGWPSRGASSLWRRTCTSYRPAGRTRASWCDIVAAGGRWGWTVVADTPWLMFCPSA